MTHTERASLLSVCLCGRPLGLASPRLPASFPTPTQAYVRDAVSSAEYESACLDLIAKFKTLRTALRDDGVPDVEHFMATYNLDCASAAARLLRSGVPATIEHGKARAAPGAAAAAVVAEATQHFITALDVLKLGMHEVDQLAPPLGDLLSALHRVPHLPPEFEAAVVTKVQDWCAQLGRMRAVDKLDEAAARQLSFDLEQGYNAFMRALAANAQPGGSGTGGRTP